MAVEHSATVDAAAHILADMDPVNLADLIGEPTAQWPGGGGTGPNRVGPDEEHRLAPARIDWPALWERPDEAEWLVEPFLARGRGHALYAPAKAGKSLLVLDVVASVAAGRPVLDQPAGPPTSALYIDQEMGPDDLRERLDELGYGPADLGQLHYYQLADLAPLDTPGGGQELCELAEHHQAALVVIDTLSRVVEGEENSADTFRNYFAHTGRPLKAAGRTTLRLDHAGKDLERDQRGSSAKGDDVDVVWRLMPREADHLTLTARRKRMAWVPNAVELHRRTEPLRHVIAAGSWPEGTARVAQQLAELDVPLDATRRGAARALRDAGHGARNDAVAAALRFRKGRDAHLEELVE